MNSDDAREFRKRQEYRIQNSRIENNYNKGKTTTMHERYTAPKGSAQRAKARDRKRARKMKLRIASLLLAAGIGIGGISVIGSLQKEPDITITQLQEMGISRNIMGLESDTLQTIDEYDQYFATFDAKTAELREEEVAEMIRDIKELNFNVIKDKMAALEGVQRKDVKLYYSFDANCGETSTKVKINEGDALNEKIFHNADFLHSKRTIPTEVSNLIVQIDKYSSLENRLHDDEISKVNAVKELEEYYNNIIEIATQKFTKDEKDRVEVKPYEIEKTREEPEGR